MAKKKCSAQHTAFTIEWAQARIKEYPDCEASKKILKAVADKKEAALAALPPK